MLAAAADHHFSVTKFVEGGVTCTQVKDLRHLKDRKKALADLAGGDLVEASSYAASLLEHHAA